MEAMWMRCNPLIRRLQQLLGSGRLGAVRQVRADLGFVVDKPPTDRLLDPALGGGALLDTGIYPLTFASLFLGEPSGVAAVAALSDQGVDLNLAVALAYDSGAVASLTSSMTALSPRNASVATDRGRLDFPAPFHHPTTVTWTPLEPDPGASPEPQELHEDLLGRGYTHEALEVARCLRNGEVESPLVPLDDTVALMRQMDTIRAQVGVRYPADDPG
jgi:predicted dehydrogenase